MFLNSYRMKNNFPIKERKNKKNKKQFYYVAGTKIKAEKNFVDGI